MDISNCQFNSLGTLPLDIFDYIVSIAADADFPHTTLSLCLVSRASHESAIKRLYHTIQLNSEAELRAFLEHSAFSTRSDVVQRYTKVAVVYMLERFQNEVLELLSCMKSLVSLSVTMFDRLADFNWAERLPRLRNLMINIREGSRLLERSTMRHVTHLYLYTSAPIAFSLQWIGQLESPSHILLIFAYPEVVDLEDDSFTKTLSDLLPVYLPASAQVVMISATEIISAEVLTRVTQITQDVVMGHFDDRVVFCVNEGEETESSVDGTYDRDLYLVHDFDGTIYQGLKAQKEGDQIGYWEAADRFIRRRRKRIHRE